jgi:hypothetical protein
MSMEGEETKGGWKIWVYMIPVYILVAIPLVKWTMKINSSDAGLSKEEANVFNTDEGEIKKTKPSEDYDPNLTDAGYNVRYRTGGKAPGSLSGDGPSRQSAERARRETAAREAEEETDSGAARQGSGNSRFKANPNQANLVSNETHKKEQMAMGYKKGYLSTAMDKVAGNPKAVGALLNNSYIVNGFMARGTVKAATGSKEGLANYLKGSGPSNFINNPAVKAALNNPAVVGSGIMAALLNTPAAQALMQDPQALADIVNNNPQLMQLAMQNPQLLSSLMANPDVASQVGKFDTSKLRQ